ncbi:c-type cytochrome [Brackiella oedipodis]|uniref:c-type cytochrome n=1 Tax=Brackiella oedipodis TaxID=124225 RepID=UPI0006858C95|nr:c-type cytochrome [Brackiella oedipodis]
MSNKPHKPGTKFPWFSSVTIVPLVVVVFLIYANGSMPLSEEDQLDVDTRIAPVALYNTGVELQAPKSDVPLTAEQVYQQVCSTCHSAGLAGAPKFEDASAWAPRIQEGEAAVFEKALKGFNGMPAKGGNPNLSDDEVKSAVVYMVNHSGGHFAEVSAQDAGAKAEDSAPEAPVSAPEGQEPAPATPEPAQ